MAFDSPSSGLPHAPLVERKLQLEIEILEHQRRDLSVKKKIRFSDFGLWALVIAAVTAVASLISSCSQNNQAKAELERLNAERLSLQQENDKIRVEYETASSQLYSMRAEALRASDELDDTKQLLQNKRDEVASLTLAVSRLRESQQTLTQRLESVSQSARAAADSPEASVLLSSALSSPPRSFDELVAMDASQRELAITAIQSVAVLDAQSLAKMSDADFVAVLDMAPGGADGSDWITLVGGVQHVSDSSLDGIWRAEIMNNRLVSFSWIGDYEIFTSPIAGGEIAVMTKPRGSSTVSIIDTQANPIDGRAVSSVRRFIAHIFTCEPSIITDTTNMLYPPRRDSRLKP